MNNHEVFLRDPRKVPIANNGVATVSEPTSASERALLRREIETFVCEGEYERGLSTILDLYLTNLSFSKQPSVWVSGFFGSGKSHFVKMLHALWSDVSFDDGATARGLVAALPDNIADKLKELSNRAKRFGVPVHAASGTLTSSAGSSVRSAVVSIVFESLGFHTRYGIGCFELWLREQGLLDAVRARVEATGTTWAAEREHLYLSVTIAEAILAERPKLANDPGALLARFIEQFKEDPDIKTDDMVAVIHRALGGASGKLPLTLIVLDEVQQFIGEDTARVPLVQEVAEKLAEKFDARVLLVATGQSAMSGTPFLEKIQGRFTIPIPLTNQDVEQVIRKVVLQKSPTCISALELSLESRLAEIAQQLPNSTIRHTDADRASLVASYPMLPARLRFWARCLDALGGLKSSAQLRNQLSLAHAAARETADLPVGNVIGAEYVVTNQAINLLSAGVLPKSIFETLAKWKAGGASDVLKSRIGSLVFVLGKLPRDKGSDILVRSNEADLTDLLVTDLHAGAKALRPLVKAALQEMEASGALMLVEGEYRWQTRSSSLVRQKFNSERDRLLAEVHTLQLARTSLLRDATKAALKKLKLTQGASVLERAHELSVSVTPPKPDGPTIPLWLCDEWSTTAKDFQSSLLAAGVDSPLVGILLPREREDELRRALADRDAAKVVLDAPPSLPGADTVEREDAIGAINTLHTGACQRIEKLVGDLLRHATVLLGGGAAFTAPTGAEDPFLAAVKLAGQQGLSRMFNEFGHADHAAWDKALRKAQKGDVDALKAVQYTGDPLQHKVVSEIRKALGTGRTGKDLRATFTGAPYGWPQEAVDTSLYLLIATGYVLAMDTNHTPVALGAIDLKKLAAVTLKPQSVVASANDKIKVRALVTQLLGGACGVNEEITKLGKLLDALDDLATKAGGAAPAPLPPDPSVVKELRKHVEAALIVEAAARDAEIRDAHAAWTETAKRVQARTPRWTLLQSLLAQASGLAGCEALAAQAEAIKTSRLLLQEPDPVGPLVESCANLLRGALTEAHGAYGLRFTEEMTKLSADDGWSKTEATVRESILAAQSLTAPAALKMATAEDVRAEFDRRSLDGWNTLREALPARFQNARMDAAKRLEPKAVKVALPSRTLRSPEDAQAWLDEVRAVVDAQLPLGPVIV